MELVLQLLLASAAVIGLMYLTMRLLRRYLHSSVSGRHLEIVEAVAVGRSARLLLVRVGTDYMVVGVAEGGVRKLADLEPVVVEAERQREETGGPGAFGETLRSWLGRHEDRD